MSIYGNVNWFKGVVERPMTEDSTGWMMAGVGADYVNLMQGLAIDGGKALSNTRLAAAATTRIIRAGLVAMMGMSNATGIGGPEKGDRFAQGADTFKSVSESLGSTEPSASWQGEASDTYAERNHEQRQRAEAMAEIDQTVKEVLDAEAEQVASTRTVLDRCQTALSLSVPLAIATKFMPGGAAASLAIEIAAVAGTVPIATDRFSDLTQAAARNATLIRRAGASYDAIASGAQPS